MVRPDKNMKIHVENFKGLRNATIDLGTFNVLIGANGSGKTSVLELFKFMNLCIHPGRTPAYPFAHWWGFENIVWSRNERLSISVHVDYKVGEYAIEYSAVISGTGGNLEFKAEHLNISDYLHVRRKNTHVEYSLDEGFKDKHKNTLIKYKREHESKLGTFLDGQAAACVSSSMSILDTLFNFKDFSNMVLISLFFPDDEKPELYIMSPEVKVDDDLEPLYLYAARLFEKHSTSATFENGLLFLRHLDYDALHQPAQTNNPALLQENGNGLINVLF